MTPLESLFACSVSESLERCSNGVDLQHLYDLVGSQRSNPSVSPIADERLDQVLFSALVNLLGRVWTITRRALVCPHVTFQGRVVPVFLVPLHLQGMV